MNVDKSQTLFKNSIGALYRVPTAFTAHLSIDQWREKIPKCQVVSLDFLHILNTFLSAKMLDRPTDQTTAKTTKQQHLTNITRELT